MRKAKVTKTRRARVRAELARGQTKIVAAAMAGEYIAGLRAGYDLAIKVLAHEVLCATHKVGPATAIISLANATREAIEARKAAVDARL